MFEPPPQVRENHLTNISGLSEKTWQDPLCIKVLGNERQDTFEALQREVEDKWAARVQNNAYQALLVRA